MSNFSQKPHQTKKLPPKSQNEKEKTTLSPNKCVVLQRGICALLTDLSPKYFLKAQRLINITQKRETFAFSGAKRGLFWYASTDARRALISRTKTLFGPVRSGAASTRDRRSSPSPGESIRRPIWRGNVARAKEGVLGMSSVLPVLRRSRRSTPPNVPIGTKAGLPSFFLLASKARAREIAPVTHARALSRVSQPSERSCSPHSSMDWAQKPQFDFEETRR